MENGNVVGGIYEVALGTTDSEAQIEYWKRFGYHVERIGELSENDAWQLYGVRSKLRSIRLGHQDADHGLIRLFVWETPINEGLQLSPMKCLGNRWAAVLTKNILHLENHIEEGKDQNMPMYHLPSIRSEIYPLKQRPRPFLDVYPSVREMLLIQPLSRQVFFQRFGYDLPFYGRVNDESFFQTSQITHFGMIIRDDPISLEFYDHVLGMKRVRDEPVTTSTFEQISSRIMFDLQPNETYGTTDFDDPRSQNQMEKMRSGRLKIIRFSGQTQLENKIQLAKPGSLGFSLYTLRVNSIQATHEKVQLTAATGVTEICSNEFNELSFSFVAPDGYFWTILQKPNVCSSS